MNIENLLRETLADMAGEEGPPHPDRFLRPVHRPVRRPVHRRGLALVAAAAVTVLALGSTVAVRTLSEPAPAARHTAAPPAPATTRVTIRPGLRLSDTLKMLADATGRPVRAFTEAAKGGPALGLPSYAKGRLEGFAHPGTYDIPTTATPAEIIASMTARFARTAQKVGLAAHSAPRDAVIIASIVQAEARDERDMPKVARVIHNRLDSGMGLEVDSTVLYGLGTYGSAASLRDIRSRSPYNTYRRRGLPPGPIANPGEAALRAALNPAPGPWLYFVATDPTRGTLKFAASQAEFAKLVAERARHQKAG
ncbi:putative YceG family protein [Nonomuraea muscovyensis]|uniref:Endolytic murein transglycosylase n=1 Tax=Nonomuraea muscovyensis TaxID=1124761 RepID=A0A7X0EY90_9ACTN|nr:endolytic transglycosylase MltG [Nonomuraea muscovyensis]MBB6345560.1 putative YceG family protein [Nonomuraea muscovyensis]